MANRELQDAVDEQVGEVGRLIVERHKNARASLGHDHMIQVRLHVDLADFVAEEAKANYQSQQEFIRSLIIREKRAREAS